MSIEQQIKEHILTQPEAKRIDMEELNRLILKINPKGKLWFFDGTDDSGKMVTNPNIGYGSYMIQYADGSSREFYQVGFSGNSTGISVNIMGLKDKNHLVQNYADKIGKAKVTGYCIRFKGLKDIDVDVLEEAMKYGFENSGL